MSAKEWSLVFANDLSDRQYHLFEVDESLLQEMLSSEISGQIKSCAMEEGKSACLSSESRTFKLKLSETSNFLMVADLGF